MGLSSILAALSLAAAQQPPPSSPSDSNTVEGVVVTGRPHADQEFREAASKFVRSLSEPTARRRLARWEEGLCPGVVGLPRKHAVYIADRIALEAQEVGLKVGQPGCRPDVLILVTGRGDATAAAFRARFPRYFASAFKRDRLESGEGREELEKFVESSEPVRTWHVSRLDTADGRGVSWGDLGGVRFPVVESMTSSRLGSQWRNDLARVLIIVDTSKLAGVSYEQLASYLVMTSLAQLKPASETPGLSSITTVFADRLAGRTPPDTMTAWDRAYLRGLYVAPADSKNLNTQRGAIRRELVRTGQRTSAQRP